MHSSLTLTFVALIAYVYAQQAGTLTAENHPSMPWKQCTASGCKDQKGSVVLDANWRWLHSTDGSTNCYTVMIAPAAV
jgi:cellulose 1,4-beta-cellobiosidase